MRRVLVTGMSGTADGDAAPRSPCDAAPSRYEAGLLLDGEVPVHRRLVRCAVELPLAGGELHGHGLRALEADRGERLLEAPALLLDDEIVDRRLVGDHGVVAACLQGLHGLAVHLQRDREAWPDGPVHFRSGLRGRGCVGCDEDRADDEPEDHWAAKHVNLPPWSVWTQGSTKTRGARIADRSQAAVRISRAARRADAPYRRRAGAEGRRCR